MTPRAALILAIAVTLSACSVPNTTAESRAVPPTITDIAARYASFQRITKDIVFVNPELAMLCRGVSKQDIDAARVRSGPHANASILIYMNDLAASAFRSKINPYPVGAVVVKEKSGSAGVGGMVKRLPGYDSAHGDWEYFYFENPARIESGRIASCVNCHQAAKARDHVFGNWLETR